MSFQSLIYTKQNNWKKKKPTDIVEKFQNTRREGSAYNLLERKTDHIQSMGHDFKLLNWNMYF